jgi:hypothetical protein
MRWPIALTLSISGLWLGVALAACGPSPASPSPASPSPSPSPTPPRVWQTLVGDGEVDQIRAMTAGDGLVFAVGPSVVNNYSQMRIVAYDANTGWVRWDEKVGTGHSRLGCQKAESQVLGDWKVGTSGFHAEPNAVVWHQGDQGAKNIEERTDKVFVAGYTGDVTPTSHHDFSVLAFSISNGDHTPLWEQDIDGYEKQGQGGDDEALALAVAGNTVFVSGFTQDNIFTIRAFDASCGNLLWQDQYVDEGRAGHAQAVATDGVNVYVVGRTIVGVSPPVADDCLPSDVQGSFYDWTVVAYPVEGGDPLWAKHYRRPCAYSGAEAIAVVAAEGRVFVGGDTFVMDEVGRRGDSGVVASKGDFSIVAYRTDGTIEWSRDYDQAFGRDTVLTLAADGGRVFAAGVTASAPVDKTVGPDAVGPYWDLIVRAFDVRDGTVAWTDIFGFPRNGTDAGTEQATQIAAGGGKVFVAGHTDQGRYDQTASQRAWLVRTYDAKGDGAGNPRLLWQDLWDNPGADEAAAVVIYGSKVFVGGQIQVPDHQADFGVRAYEP